MESTCFNVLSPGSWSIECVPTVGDVRPSRCPACRRPSWHGSRVVLHGHGVRMRQVVVPPAFEDGLFVRVVECWQRRYRCTACGAITVVLPRGVLPRFLYSVAAIVVAFFLVSAPPIGAGMSDAQAYARQGMFATLSSYAEEPYRWRSLGRWLGHATAWWSGWTGTLSSLLLLFAERAPRPALAEAVHVAITHHVRWGVAR